MEKPKHNPLASLMRQPKIYIKLPSNSKYWPADSLNRSVNDEYPIFSMTARDELLLKTPDALLNGQAVVDVIQSCMPNVLNAWDTPNIDMDAILIAIRLATYGEMMETTVDMGGENEFSYQVDLRILLDKLYNDISWEERIEVSDQMVIYTKPLSYKSITKTAVQTFETQKIISIISDSTLSDDEKIKTFRESFTKLTEITVGLVAESVYKIESTAGVTDEPQFIKEFMENCDKSIFDIVKNHLDLMRDTNMLKPMTVNSTEEMRKNGMADTLEIPIVFDPANFFG